MHKIAVLILAGSAIALNACASFNVSTDMASARDPAWRPDAPLRRILVYMATPHLGVRQATEAAFAQHSRSAATTFVPSTEIIFPGRAYSPEAAREIMARHGIDAVLTIAASDSGTNIGTFTTPTRTQSNAHCSGTEYSVNCSGAETTTGGQTYEITKPWERYHVWLSVPTQEPPVWTATADARGNGFASWGQLREMMVRRTLDQLAKDHILGSR